MHCECYNLHPAQLSPAQPSPAQAASISTPDYTQVLHSFGAGHDPGTVECGGRYLMSRYSGSGLQANNEAISPCTARSVAALLADTRATHCLVTRESSGQVAAGKYL